MNVVSDRGGHPPLRDDEALVVERAVRLAVDSVLNVLYSVYGGRSREQQRMVADRDKEIRRLEGRLTLLEQELRLLRCQGCACGMYGPAPGGLGGLEGLGALEGLGGLGGRGPAPDRPDRTQGGPEPGGAEPGCGEPEAAAGQQECEMSFSLGLFGGPPSHVSSHSLESALPSSPGRLLLDQSCSSHASSEVTAPPSPSSLLVKEEPCDIDAVLIKWEMSEERGGGGGADVEGGRSPGQHGESPGGKVTNGDTFREKPESDPGGEAAPPAEEEARSDSSRNKKRSVPMSELPEEVQRLKRAAWRAASRRYYARKVARQQANPPRPAAFHHMTSCHYSPPPPPPPPPPGSLAGRRRATLISQLPEECQTLQREAWRASSRRYYARKMARHQGVAAAPAPFGRLPGAGTASAPAGDTRRAGRGGARSGGIACS